MSSPKEPPAGAPCWIELLTSDQDRSMHFYCELFGWSVRDGGSDFGGYKSFEKDGELVGGCRLNDPDSAEGDFWTTFLVSEDVDATIAAVTRYGGQVALAPDDVNDLGRMAMIIDPGQGCVGVWQPGAHHGLEVTGKTGTPAWFELHTAAYEASVAFYRDVFGWETHVPSETSEVRYTTFGQDEDALAAVMEIADSKAPSQAAEWRVFFEVADTATTIARLVDLGGSIVGPLQDSPYGRIAGVADSTGAQFTIRDHR